MKNAKTLFKILIVIPALYIVYSIVAFFTYRLIVDGLLELNFPGLVFIITPLLQSVMIILGINSYLQTELWHIIPACAMAVFGLNNVDPRIQLISKIVVYPKILLILIVIVAFIFKYIFNIVWYI